MSAYLDNVFEATSLEGYKALVVEQHQTQTVSWEVRFYDTKIAGGEMCMHPIGLETTDNAITAAEKAIAGHQATPVVVMDQKDWLSVGANMWSVSYGNYTCHVNQRSDCVVWSVRRKGTMIQSGEITRHASYYGRAIDEAKRYALEVVERDNS
jgi:hypothetical protein